MGSYGALEPGMLELYALGALSPEEAESVRYAVAHDDDLRRELEDLDRALEMLAMVNATAPPSALRAKILSDARIGGSTNEPMCVIHGTTRTADLPQWIFAHPDPDPNEYENMHVVDLQCPPQLASALVWVKHYVSEEEHDVCHEAFHILEGTCEVLVGDVLRRMGPGESISIPLHVPHSVRITSPYPCKAVVQRRPLEAVL